jgi:hypothetical protein
MVLRTIWVGRKFRGTFSTSDLSQIWKLDENWWTCGPICGPEIESGWMPLWCDIIANEFWSNGVANNLSWQKVSRYFLDLGSVSNLEIGQELIDLWSIMWLRNNASRCRVGKADKRKISSIMYWAYALQSVYNRPPRTVLSHTPVLCSTSSRAYILYRILW